MYLGSITNGTNSASATTGWTLYQQFVAGVNPTNPTAYLKILSCDIASSNSNDIAVQVYGGSATITNTYGSATFTRSFTVLAANNNSVNGKSVIGSVADNLSGTNTFTDVGAASGAYSSRVYNVMCTYAGMTVTNSIEEWGAFVQNRATNQSYFVCVPVDYGNTNLANLNSTLGQQLGRGLYNGGSSGTSAADYVQYIDTSGNWQKYYWTTNAAGSNIWWNGATTNLQVTPGMAFWVVRGNNAAIARSNAVFTGRTFQTQSVTNFVFKTNYTGWTMFGWPLASNKVNNGGTTSASNQLGFETVGLGGTSTDPNKTNKWGDQIWVWKNNTWREYWLMDDHLTSGASTNDHKWKDPITGKFGNFALEPGMGYYYWHASNFTDTAHGITNIIGTNFFWGPP
jgi:hypothetical protein